MRSIAIPAFLEMAGDLLVILSIIRFKPFAVMMLLPFKSTLSIIFSKVLLKLRLKSNHLLAAGISMIGVALALAYTYLSMWRLHNN